MIRQVLVDLDDVCNHLTMHVLSMLGCSSDEFDYPVRVGYDIVAAYNTMTPDYDITAGEFWTMVTPDIWETMPKREDTEWLLDLCAECVGRENVMICTKSLADPLHFAGKVQWMYDHLPHWIQRQYSITPVKHAYAHHDVLLIDDCGANIEEFRGTRHGKGILVPRPWNRNYRLNPHQHIEESLKDLMTLV